MRVVVVGAGFAGLGAARTLDQEGVEVVVLEATNCLGGRAHSIVIDGRPAPAGAAWLHGIEDNALLPLARAAGVVLAPSDDDDYTIFRPDGEFDDSDYELADDFEASLSAALEAAQSGVSVGSIVERLRPPFDDRWGRSTTDYWIRGMIDEEFTADPHDLDVVTTQEGDEQPGGDLLLPEGFGPLIDQLASGLDIRMLTRVDAIDYGNAVLVSSSTGTYEADAVVVTLPLDMIRRLHLMPALDARYERALVDLDIGNAAKIFLTFEERFWPSSVIGLTDVHNPWVNFYDISTRGRPTLMGFACGRDAQALKASDERLVAAACRTLTIVGGFEPIARASRVVRWCDEAARAYSFVPMGGRSDARRVFAEPVDARLVFAGEAVSSRFPATTHGAYLSGVDAARQIVSINR